MSKKTKQLINISTFFCLALVAILCCKASGERIYCFTCVTKTCDNNILPCFAQGYGADCDFCNSTASKRYCTPSITTCYKTGTTDCGQKDEGSCINGRCVWSYPGEGNCGKSSC